ncbi:Glycosyl transferase family 2 [Paenibacillus konkukensis]|uniref:Glycosyl transferase family 2 n=1 Tax=Paenibacillus konkukensis TaxID=2020716 RepID=A0ABY4RS42_9BACL|nr:glycosyltransferase [Paenibacillus konkukensis]UQZ84760.1 Glycosyl transferase family 2 [Paenibacillus konkukensis]
MIDHTAAHRDDQPERELPAESRRSDKFATGSLPQDTGVADADDRSGVLPQAAAAEIAGDQPRPHRPLRRVRKASGNRLTAMMQVRNESGRYLKQVLAELCTFVDDIVVVDDGSTDDTVAICQACPKVAKLVALKTSRFGQEWELRSLLWEAAVSTSPDWLLSVDADELYEDKAKRQMRELIDQDRYDWVGFRFYDLWGGTTHYREDAHWNVHKHHTMALLRYFPQFPYAYPRWDHHVPRLPLPCIALPGLLTDLRVKHLGWAGSLEDRVRKYLRYKQIDPEGRWGSLAQYESILDLNPNLIEWKEDR